MTCLSFVRKRAEDPQRGLAPGFEFREHRLHNIAVASI